MKTNPVEEALAVEKILASFFPTQAYVCARPIANCEAHPEEEALMAKAVERRRREFSTGRMMAREGLLHLGFKDVPVGIGRLKNPLWPTGIHGAISHDGKICAVALMRECDKVSRFGIDLIWLGRNNCVAEFTELFVSNRGELSIMSTLGLEVDRELLLFSLKESLVKALSLEVGHFIDMKCMEIAARPPGILVKLGAAKWPARLHCAVAYRYLVTIVILEE